MAELALAHRISNAVEAAYRRADTVEKRRTMIADWAEFLTENRLTPFALDAANQCPGGTCHCCGPTEAGSSAPICIY